MSEEIAIAGCLTVLVMVILALPILLRRGAAAPRAAYDLAVYQDQLAEVDRDLERRLISPGQAAAARAEIGRRMLAAGTELRPSPAPPRRLSMLGLAAVVLLPVAAVPFYARIGSPGIADRPFAGRILATDTGPAAPADGAAPAPHADMGDAVSRLAARLKQNPDDGAGWLLLARSYIATGRMQEGADAFRHVYDLSNHSPAVAADYGEALVAVADGTVTADAKQLFQSALKDPEGSLRARYYLALATRQAGDEKGALQSWVDLEHDVRADAPWLPALQERITETAAKLGIDPATLKTTAGAARPAIVAAAPSTDSAPADAAAAPSGEPTPDQQTMINAMVAQLSERLKQQPNDPDGWVRLGRSYMVMDKPVQARDAYAQAARLKPEDQDIKTAYAEAMIVAAATAGAPPPEPAVAVMRDLLKADGQNPEALWYVGDAEAAAGHKDVALDLWRKLLAQLPADAPFRATVETRIAAVQGGTQ